MTSKGCFSVESCPGRLIQLQLLSPMGLSNSLTGKWYGSDGANSANSSLNVESH